MTKTQKTLLTAGIITAIILWFSRKRSKAKSATQNAVDDLLSDGGGQTVAAPDEQRLFYGTDSDFENEIFFFSTPVGNFTITQPDTSSPRYNALHSDTEFQFGWQAPTEGVVLVTLMPMEQHPIVENIVLDLNQKTVQFEYVQL